jgi:hypothetical protein
MKQLILLILSVSFGNLYAQTTEDCVGLLSQPLPYDIETRQWESEPLLEGTALLLACEFEEEDHALLVDWPFHNFLIELAVTDWQRQPNYRDMRDYFKEVQQTPKYLQAKGVIAAPVTFGTTIADTATWEQDIQLISGFIPSQGLLDDLYALTTEYQNKGKTYGDLIDIYKMRQDALNPEMPYPFDMIDGNSQVFPYEKALTLAKLEEKPILLFFAGYASVGSVKMEDIFQENEDLQQYLNDHFICLRLYADSRTELEPPYQFQTSGERPRTIRRIGQRNVHFQMSRFGTNTQPFFVILSPDEEELGRQEYTSDIEAFRAFLRAAIR